MTIDDESSVYVGGLSYETTEDALRERFEEFGSVVAVKIIFDPESGTSRGYGFVTFTNPRSAAKAINDMDGEVLEGRTLRVNEVMNRNGRGFGRDNNFRDRGRGRDARNFRFRDRSGNARHFSPPRNRRLSPGSFHSDRGRPPVHRHSHSPTGYSPSRSPSPAGRHENHSSTSPSPRSSDRLQGGDALSTGQTKNDRRAAKERESEVAKMKDELEKAKQKRDELRIKVAGLEEEEEMRERELIDQQNKSQKLEEALLKAVAANAERQNQLSKFLKTYLQLTEYNERAQQCHKELKALLELEVKGEARAHGLADKPEDMDLQGDDGGHVNIDD